MYFEKEEKIKKYQNIKKKKKNIKWRKRINVNKIIKTKNLKNE